ncbi:unnamed protein product [Urochloa humidicola]
MAAASDRAEVDTARPFRSVKEAVAVFGDRILVGGESHSRHHSSSAASIAIATPNANANANANASADPNAMPTLSAKHEASSSTSSSSTMTFSPNPMAVEAEEEEITAATVPMYSAPSSPPSLTSSPSPAANGRGVSDGDHEAGGPVAMRSIRKLEAEVAETRQEVAQLRKRGNEMEMAVASLNAQLHRGLSKLAEMEAAAAARRSTGGDTDVASTLRWGADGNGKLGVGECCYLPSFSHALSLGEVEIDDELMGSRRRKAQKVKPIVPLIGDILFSKRKSAKEKVDGGFYSGDLHSVF